MMSSENSRPEETDISNGNNDNFKNFSIENDSSDAENGFQDENPLINHESKPQNSDHTKASQPTFAKESVTNRNNNIDSAQNTKDYEASQDKNPKETYQNVDLRYSRLPKDIITQDLGNIVKNMHGIFSSVSGSLKNAINTQKAQIPVNKHVVNGKIMNELDTQKVDEDSNQGINEELTLDSQELNENNQDIELDPKEIMLRLLVVRKENAALQERLKHQLAQSKEKEDLYKEAEVKMEQMKKQTDLAEREKDAAVMRYAGVECASIEARKAADAASRAEKAAKAELDLVVGKLKSAHAEKQRICQLYDDKCHELQTVERELNKEREELKEVEGRLKWTQGKLRLEMDAYKESAERVEKLNQRIQELETAKEVVAANATEAAKAKQFEAELKESQAALILCRYERDELDKRLASVTKELQKCTEERDSYCEALKTAKAEIEVLRSNNAQLEEEAAELASLRAQAALADSLIAELERERARAAGAEAEAGRERARAATCAMREAAALEHAERLAAEHAARAQRDAATQQQEQVLSVDNAALRGQVAALETELSSTRSELLAETDRRKRDNMVLARKVAELTEEIDEVNKKLEWEKGENAVLKKKHASALKEVNRELAQARKRCEQLEARAAAADDGSTRTDSVSSLSSGEGSKEDNIENGHSDLIPNIKSASPSRQALVERVVAARCAAARRAERVDFLEEHARHLTAELSAKTRLLRALLPALPRTAHASEIERLGGALAAAWGGDGVPRGELTPQLALEVNARLQTLLEDTLLKNITLQDNIDTLGKEIARLKQSTSSTEDGK